ncbi:unnamed protein product [Paramecium pentaurelia]|uniref:Protein kinase domain-containing protein n=1 Tax=Paramecium pentaurelia TaxID=43138 RepID=A0A8S1RWN0_9CILI|nr:unnamed protein product [Paramecium pentaurelia]
MKNNPITKLGKYLMLEEIGKGNTGIVYKALDTETKKIVAIKKIPKEKADIDKNNIKKYIENEKMILYFCKEKGYQNIIQIIDSFVTINQHYIVLEYCPYNLLKYVNKLKSNSEFLSEDIAITILLQINQAMLRLHENFIYHRDLKPENVLIFDQDGNCQIKITDFGFSIILSKEDLLTTSLGTQGYIAPEIQKGQIYDPKQSDMYSLGVILYKILCNPKDDKDEKETRFDFKLNPNLSNEMKDLIEKMVRRDPQDRLKWEELGYQQAIQKNNLTHTQELNNYHLKKWENKIQILNCCLEDIQQTKQKHQDLKNILEIFEYQILIKKKKEIEKQLERINLQSESKEKQQQEYQEDILKVQNQQQQLNIQIIQDYEKEFENNIIQRSQEVENLKNEIQKNENENSEQNQQNLAELKEKKKQLDELQSLRYKIKFYDDFDNDFYNVFEKEKIRKRYKNKFDDLLTETQNGLQDFNSFFKSLQLNNLKQTNQNLLNLTQNSQILLNEIP